MPARIESHGLSIDAALYRLVAEEIAPGSGVEVDDFWRALGAMVTALGGKNRTLLRRRAALQKRIDAWHRDHPGRPEPAPYRAFLQKIGYLQAAPARVSVRTAAVDDEIAVMAGPQLVVPLDNARYVLNAANARWGSLYDALYASDVILEVEGCKRTAKYNPVRGAKVIQYAREFLDQAVPLAVGSHAYAVRYKVRSGKLCVVMGDGSETELGWRESFVGYRGAADAPTAILLKHNHLHIEIRIGEGYYIGRGDLAGIYDVQLESALTTIMDCEDSVAAVDAADKVRAYQNWCGLMKGDLRTTVHKGGQAAVRTLAPDREYCGADGAPYRVPGRSLMFIRHVGAHMTTDAVTMDGAAIPETFLDAMVTLLAAKHDVLGNGRHRNSRHGSIYVVKPKMHGAAEVAAAVALFAHAEAALGLVPNTVKIGIMDEERRTTVNLKACIGAALDRVVFINTGFLDRTGDEIHTCMEAGAVLPKNHIKTTPWLLAYEDWNVDIGLQAGLPGHAQIGKGMWAAPDAMAAMMEQKFVHPRAGASCAWVPSPLAATLHALHYHHVNVQVRQQQLRGAAHAQLDDILTLPLLERPLSDGEVAHELENNAQSILGYVVRWVQRGIGCSKVPDLSDTPLMEDRATLRISSQHIANWLHHGLVTEAQVRSVFEKMAAVVDRQNAADPAYQPMAPHCNDLAFQAALALVLGGRAAANGYTEGVLHLHRRLQKILDGLERAEIRCTYAAVAELTGLTSRKVRRHFAPPHPAAAWVVGENGEPRGHRRRDKPAALYRTDRVISDGAALAEVLAEALADG